MEILAENLKQIKVPTSSDNIYSEECVFSYDTPVNSLIKLIFSFIENCFAFFQESDDGLYISLTSFLSFGKDYVDRYYQKTKNAVFLHIKRTKTEVKINFFEVKV